MSCNTPIICVDLQNDFASEGGGCYQKRPSVDFLLENLFPYLKSTGSMVAEIISDYRQPRPGDDRDCCRPGEWGYESLLPEDLRKGVPWVKCMNSPIWTRPGIGDPSATPGEPFQDPGRFGDWLDGHVGKREDVCSVVIVGLTADCCVLSVVQELRWRGFDVLVLSEGTDVRSGDPLEKKRFLSSPPFTFWGRSITFPELKGWF
ncbi:MAG: cysteine hydrolase family protein [Thermoplasmatota archaeon]